MSHFICICIYTSYAVAVSKGFYFKYFTGGTEDLLLCCAEMKGIESWIA